MGNVLEACVSFNKLMNVRPMFRTLGLNGIGYYHVVL